MEYSFIAFIILFIVCPLVTLFCVYRFYRNRAIAYNEVINRQHGEIKRLQSEADMYANHCVNLSRRIHRGF